MIVKLKKLNSNRFNFIKIKLKKKNYNYKNHYKSI